MAPEARRGGAMTQEDRLRQLAAGLLSRGRLDAEAPYGMTAEQRVRIIGESQRNADACLAGADALCAAREVRTCSTCRWLRHAGAHFEDTEPACGHESEAHPLHWCQPVGNADTFGCTFWEAREGEGGEG